MAQPPIAPNEIFPCPVSVKNAMDDILYTIVQKWAEDSGDAAYWQGVMERAYTNYNETFRDLAITWLRMIRKIRRIDLNRPVQ